jgi:hypothetical protein
VRDRHRADQSLSGERAIHPSRQRVAAANHGANIGEAKMTKAEFQQKVLDLFKRTLEDGPGPRDVALATADELARFIIIFEAEADAPRRWPPLSSTWGHYFEIQVLKWNH